MDSWDNWDSTVLIALENTCSLMGYESYLSGYCISTAAKSMVLSSFSCGGYENVVSGMLNTDLEVKEDSRSNALEPARLIEAHEVSFKEEHKNVEAEAPNVFIGEEQYDFPELSLLGGDCMVSSCNVGIGAEVEYISRMFNDGRGCNDCENSFLDSLNLDEDGPLVGVDGDLVSRDGFCYPHLSGECTIASITSNCRSTEGRMGGLSSVESYKSNIDNCSDNATNLDGESKDYNQLFGIENDLGLPLQSSRKLKETCQVNNFDSSCKIVTSHQKVEVEILGDIHIDHEASCSAQGSTGESAYCSAVERCTSENLSFGKLDIKGSTFDSFKRTSTCCSIDTDCSTEEEILPGIANSTSLTSIRRSNPKRAASLRSNLADGKSTPRNQNDRRKCRRKFGFSTSCTPQIHKMFNGVNRKIRTHRKPRLSAWGTVESLLTIIKRRDELLKHNSVPDVVRRNRSNKAGRGINRRKRKTTFKNNKLRLSSAEIHLSCRSIQPSVLLAGPPLENGIKNIMLTSDFHTGTSTKVEQNLGGKWYAAVRSNMREGQQEEKDLESTLTQETSSDNLLSEFHGVSSRVDTEFVAETVDDENPSYPGNSPDSDVYNPSIDVCNLTFESSTIFLNKNSQIQELKDEDGLDSVAPNFIKPFVARLPLLARRMQACENQRRKPMKGHKGKKKLKENRGKKGKREGKGKKEMIGMKTWICESPVITGPPGEEGLGCQVKSNEDKKAPLRSDCSLNCKEVCDNGDKYSKVSRKQCKFESNPERLLLDSSVSGLSDLNEFTHFLKTPNRAGSNTSPLQNELNEQFEEILPSGYGREHHVHRSTKKRLSKNKSNRADSTRHVRQFIDCHKKENILKSNQLGKADVFSNENDNVGFSLGATNNVSQLEGETVAVDVLLKDTRNDVARPISIESTGEPCNIFSGQSSFSGKKAWALCDDCQKWRCVPDELVHVIEKGRWTCKDNVDEAFGDCTIPQEKTDEDINNDLGISDEQYCSTSLHSYGECAPLRPSAAARTTWTSIKSNLFLHRNRRTQTIDEIMVCHCKPSLDGGLGCGEECLNRLLNIECIKGTCPCGNLCSNQQFQKRKYAKFKWLKCGKKGYGLQLEHNVSRGQFLIEYVGEVLDLAAYEARLRYYAGRGQRHFYFMTLNGGEVIDACDKGNLGRFINHSCDPNCRTEKWMVNGEVCIGLFALRDIKKGEEITFDYNYVRVFGAAAKKCVCGSAECRGYIGGDPSSSEVIVQDDSDVEDLEPVMIDGENKLGVKGIDSVATDVKVTNLDFFSVERNDTDGNYSFSEQGVCIKSNGLENQDAIHQLSSALGLSDSLMQISIVESESNACKLPDVQTFQEVKFGLSSIEHEQTINEDVNEGPPFSAVYRSLPHGQFSESPEQSLNTLLQTDHAVHEPLLDDAAKVSSQNSCSFMHTSSCSIGTSEEILTTSKPVSVEKTLRHIKVKRSRVSIRSVASGKTKKVSTVISNRHIEGVEEKLNELLGGDGGICRKKDAAKGYLKLLVVTAAAGDETKGSMSQSARDLSLILDAILKTKSRMVLVDIINKNGLQMLHNMMKQNRDNFNRIPILRKLLKVLEFLAEKEILTIDHIHAPPPRSDMESFRESMLKLMKHRDTQVHLIARNFADQWIPRNFRRAEPSDRDGRQPCANYSRSNCCQTSNINSGATNCHPSSEVDIHGESLPLPSQAASTSTSFTDTALTEFAMSRKRKTRWDQPSDVSEQASECSADHLMRSSGSSGVKLARPSQLEPISDTEAPSRKSAAQNEGNNSGDKIVVGGGGDEDDDEMPPGFGSPREDEVHRADIDGATVVIGHPQERYLASQSVAYGVPIALVRQQGWSDSSLKIAPAMPFRPFPPLPPYPRQMPCPRNAGGMPFNRNSNSWRGVERPGFPKHGHGRFFHQHQQQQWNNHRPQRF